MTRRWVFGLQGWLVGALLAVGMAASLAVLLVVLPTLESSVRGDRAKRDGEELMQEVRAAGQNPGVSNTVTQDQLRDLVTQLRSQTGAEVRVDVQGIFVSTSAQAPPRLTLLPRVSQLAFNQPTVFDDDTSVAAAAPLYIDGQRQGTIAAAREVTGLAPELAIVRRRVIIAMAVVLGLATLAGIALARVLGGRIRRLATTAATLAAGDLAARAPVARVAPTELMTLGDSLNGMAAQLQSLVAEITSERDRDRALIGSLAEGVVAVAPDGAVVVTNEAATRLLSLPQDGPARLDALPPAIIDAVREARTSGAPEPTRRQVVLPDGVELEMHVANLAADETGGTVVTLRDVTDERRLERARRDLVANVSHELKTPIAALKGFLELLEGEGVDERHRREFLQSMTQETGRLERLVEEQLQLARLDSGALPLDRREVDLDDLAEVVAAPRVPLAAREGLTLAVTPSPGGPLVADVDPARIEQILLILLDNAMRHTPAGGRVDVIVGRDGQDATIAVRDTGEGIAPDVVPFVFDRFYRGDPSREGRSAGLGLAIARGLAAAHRGSLELESRVGAGSTITLRLPLLEAGPVTEETPIPGLRDDAPPPAPPG